LGNLLAEQAFEDFRL
jgi:hypothetical protein